MTGLMSALTVGNLASLRSNYAGEQYLSLCPNVRLVETTVTAVPSTASFAQITCAESTWTGVRVGQTVLIAHEDNERAAFFRGYVRAQPSGNTLYINATSAGIEVGDYVWVLDDYAVHVKAARDTDAGYYKDWDEAYHAPRPLIYNLKTAYAGWVDPTTNVLTLSLAPSAQATNPDASATFTWAWDVADGTIIVGGTNTQNITVTFPATDEQRWVHLTVTDSVGTAQTFHFFVAAHDEAHPPALGFTGAEIVGDVDAGWSASVEAFTGVEEVLDQTLCVIWSREFYGDIEAGNAGGLLETWAIEFVGRLRKEVNQGRSDSELAYTAQVSFEIEGPTAQLARLDAAPLALRNTSSPAVWDELETLTIWRAVAHLLDTHSTFLTVHSLSSDDVTDDFQQPLLGTEDGSLLGAVNALGAHINASLEFAPDGRSLLARNLRFGSDAARAAATVIADWQESDLIDLELEHGHAQLIGAVEADGGCYNTLTDAVTPFLSLAPGVQVGSAEAKSALRSQVLRRNQTDADAQAELNFRCGQALDAENPHDRLTIQFPAGYHILIPSRAAVHTWTLTGDTNVRDITLDDTRLWLLTSIRHWHDNDAGTKEVQGVFEHLPAAAPSGQTVTYPDPVEISDQLSAIPPFAPFPAFPELPEITLPTVPAIGDSQPTASVTVASRNGNTVLVWTDSALWLSLNFLSAAPTYRDITPATGVEIKSAQFDPTDVNMTRAYCLVYDAAADESVVYRTDNVFANPPEWTAGAAAIGEYDLLRLSSSEGELTIYRSGEVYTGNWSQEFDFAYGQQGWEPQVRPVWGECAVWSGNRWTDVHVEREQATIIERAFTLSPGSTITRIYVYGGLTSIRFYLVFRNAYVDLVNCTRTSPGYDPLEGYADVSYDDTTTRIGVEVDAPEYGSNYSYINRVVVEGTGSDPFAGEARTRTSTDFGTTWGAEVVVGTSPTAPGAADTIRVGDVILAAASEQVRTAAIGGAYSDETNGDLSGADPALLLIPLRDFGAATKNTSEATPEYLLGTSDIDGSGETLYRVTDAGKTAITPTISGVDALPVGPEAAAIPYANSSKIALLATVSGVVHLLTTANGGSSWTDRGALANDAWSVRMRRSDRAALQLFIADGADGPAYSPNFGATIIHKPWPSSDPVIGCEVYG